MKQLRPVIIHNMSDDYKKNGKNEKLIKLKIKFNKKAVSQSLKPEAIHGIGPSH